MAVGKAVRAAYGADKSLIDDVSVFDVFEGGGVGEGKKSFAISVTLQPYDATMTDAEIEAHIEPRLEQFVKYSLMSEGHWKRAKGL